MDKHDKKYLQHEKDRLVKVISFQQSLGRVTSFHESLLKSIEEKLEQIEQDEIIYIHDLKFKKMFEKYFEEKLEELEEAEIPNGSRITVKAFLDLQDENKKLKDKIAHLKWQYHTANRACDTAVQKLNNHCKYDEALTKTLQSQITVLVEEGEEYKALSKKYSKESEESKAILKNYADEIRTLYSERSDLKTQIKNLLKENEASKALNQKYCDELTSLKHDLSASVDDMKKWRSQSIVQQKIIERIGEEIKAYYKDFAPFGFSDPSTELSSLKARVVRIYSYAFNKQ